MIPDDVSEVALSLRQKFDRFMLFSRQPSSLMSTADRMATAKRAVALAAMRNTVEELEGTDDDFNFHLETDICSEHDATTIMLYLHLAEDPDREVEIWAEEMEKEYRLSRTQGLSDEVDFVIETCRSFYAASEMLAQDELEDRLGWNPKDMED